jgi:cytochrome c peroxidase
LRGHQSIGAIDVHSAGTTDPLSARPPKSQCLVDLILDLDECVEHHGPARINIHFVSVEARVQVVAWTPAVDTERLDPLTCFDCHSNGHTNKATHLAPDARPQESRHRIDTPTLRGVQIQRLFGSQRALKTVEDFTQFEQAGAYFDGDHVIAAKKGMNPLDRLTQVNLMAEFQEELGFPPAPKLDVFGKLDPSKATAAELRGQEVFFGKGQCGACHAAPYYTDNLMHDLKTERFFKPEMVNGINEVGDGAVKTFPLRGIKDSPPYLHDGRLLTLDDTVEFFNLVLGTKLTGEEKHDLVAFIRTL